MVNLEVLTVGAYASEPASPSMSEKDEERWYGLLGELEFASGIETYFRGTLHPGAPRRLARLLPTGWHIIPTMLPHTVARVGQDAGYGLASASEDGRRAAVADVRQPRQQLEELRDALGRDSALGVHLQSAPKHVAYASNAGALATSLIEIASWEWGSTALVVEHCDGAVAGQKAAKGYLPLEDETRAVLAARASGASALVGQAINWGRSAIEGRSAATPAEHLAVLLRPGTAAGLIFSGAAETDGPLGRAWDDVHNPLHSTDPGSLLTPETIAASLALLDSDAGPGAADGVLYVGAKVQDPRDARELDRRLDPLREVLRALRPATAYAHPGTPSPSS